MPLKELNVNVPYIIRVGRGSLSEAPPLISEMLSEGENAFILGSGSVWPEVEWLSSELQASGFNTKVAKVSAASPEEVSKLVGEGRGSSLIIGIGGGRNIDVAKAVAHDLGAKLVSIPTTTSTDAMATPFAILWEDGRSRAVEGATPLLLIADLDLIWRAPERLQFAGFGDYVAKVTALPDLELAYMLGKEENFSPVAVSMAHQFTEMLIEVADGIPARDEEVWKLYILLLALDGMLMSMCNTTRIAAGSEHLFAYALDEVSGKKLLHGETVGLGAALLAPLHGIDREYVLDALDRASLPTSFTELGVSREEVITALTLAHKMRSWYTVLGEGMSKEAAERLARGLA